MQRRGWTPRTVFRGGAVVRSLGCHSMAWLVPALIAAVAAGQLTIEEEFSFTGTVDAVAAGRLTVRDAQGQRREVRVQERNEKGVALRDGRLLAFPAEIRVTGGVDVGRLKPGQVVRFSALLNGRGSSTGEVAEVTLVDGQVEPGVVMREEPAKPTEHAPCEVTGAVKRADSRSLVVELPQAKAFSRKTVLAFKLAQAAKGLLESGDLRRIEPGARIVRLDAVRLDTGDVVARAVVAENPAAAAVRERGDDALANKYRGLSDVPKKEPRLIRSAHFAFLSDVSDREARIILDKLERMAGLLQNYFRRPAAGVVEGFVVRDLEAWRQHRFEEPFGREKITRGEGVCFNATLGDERRAVLYSCADHGVIQHECMHGICHMTFGSTGPTWLAEGVAELGNYWNADDPAVDIEPVVMAYLQNAEPKRRLLEIAVPGRTEAGGWQDYAWRWALCYLLANNPNYAERFKPLAISLMEGRDGVSFESVYGPQAREISFEYDQFLRTVGNGYRADLTAWPWQAKFSRLAAGGSLKTTVKAAAGWQASRLRVEQGVTYELETQGTWRTSKAGEALAAAGDQEGHGRLVAAVFHEFELGPEIPLADSGSFSAPADGDLFLRCADDWTQLADNDGEITVTFRRAAAP